MSKKSKKKKVKKISAKKERYAKFRKDKSVSFDLTMPDLTPEQFKQKQEAEINISRFLRFNRNLPTKELKEKRLKRK